MSCQGDVTSCIPNYIFCFTALLYFLRRYDLSLSLSLSALYFLLGCQPTLPHLLPPFFSLDFFSVNKFFLLAPLCNHIHINLGSNLFLFRPVKCCCEMVTQVNGFLLPVHHLMHLEPWAVLRLIILRNISARSGKKWYRKIPQKLDQCNFPINKQDSRKTCSFFPLVCILQLGCKSK